MIAGKSTSFHYQPQDPTESAKPASLTGETGARCASAQHSHIRKKPPHTRMAATPGPSLTMGRQCSSSSYSLCSASSSWYHFASNVPLSDAFLPCWRPYHARLDLGSFTITRGTPHKLQQPTQWQLHYQHSLNRC